MADLPALIPPDWPRLYRESMVLYPIGEKKPRHRWDYWKVEIEGETLKEYALFALGPEGPQAYCIDQIYKPETRWQKLWRAHAWRFSLKALLR